MILAARDAAALEAVAEELRAGGARASRSVRTGDDASVRRLVERTLETHGRLDAAMNNATDGPRPAPLAASVVTSNRDTAEWLTRSRDRSLASHPARPHDPGYGGPMSLARTRLSVADVYLGIEGGMADRDRLPCGAFTATRA